MDVAEGRTLLENNRQCVASQTFLVTGADAQNVAATAGARNVKVLARIFTLTRVSLSVEIALAPESVLRAKESFGVTFSGSGNQTDLLPLVRQCNGADVRHDPRRADKLSRCLPEKHLRSGRQCRPQKRVLKRQRLPPKPKHVLRSFPAAQRAAFFLSTRCRSSFGLTTLWRGNGPCRPKRVCRRPLLTSS